MMITKFALALLLVVAGFPALAQQPVTVPFNDSRWTVTAKEVLAETYLGKDGIRVTGGSLILKDAGFKNGLIEFDIALQQARYFPAIAFRLQDLANTELYYFRPHQSGNADAMQYYPVFHGADNWQLYYGEGFNNPSQLPFDRWLHVRLLVKDTAAEVYFDNGNTPVLYISKLKRPIAAGSIAFENTSAIPVRLANFSYTTTDDVNLINKPKPQAPLTAGMITAWRVSDPFDEAWIIDKPQLAFADTGVLRWQILNTDERGIADLSILAGAIKGKNTVFARTVIWSDRPAVKKFLFGFSDRAAVYLNGRLLYRGTDDFLSRDYRFLGTLGLFDAVYLALQKGKNEIWVAVSETTGGWGIAGKFE